MDPIDATDVTPPWTPSQALTWRLDDVAIRFSQYLDLYAYEPHPTHVGAIARLRELVNDPVAAVADDLFTDLLLTTLRKWRVFRGLKGVNAPTIGEFRTALASIAATVTPIVGESIEDEQLDIPAIAVVVNEAIRALSDALHRSSTPLVLGTKTLHHILPDLIPPMDRENTGWFFTWAGYEMGPPWVYDTIEHALIAFNQLATVVKPAQFVTGSGWRTSASKLLDNAICAYRR